MSTNVCSACGLLKPMNDKALCMFCEALLKQKRIKHCENCPNWNNNICSYLGRATTPDWFCAEGCKTK